MIREFTKENVISWVKRQLGSPTIRVELEDEQILDCMENALLEISPYHLERHYITVDVQSKIDLSEYNVAYVTTVYRADPPPSNYSTEDVFNPIATTSTTRSISGSSIIRSYTYQSVETSLVNQIFSSTKGGMSYKYIAPYLYIDVGYPTTKQITIEYSPIISDLDDLTDDLYRKFFKDFTLAYARRLLSDIRGKLTTTNSIVTLDSSSQYNKYQDEIQHLRERLSSSCNAQFIID